MSIEWRFSFYFVAAMACLKRTVAKKKCMCETKSAFCGNPIGRAILHSCRRKPEFCNTATGRAGGGGRGGVENDSASGHLDRVTCTYLLYSGNKCWGRHAQLPMKVWWCAKSNTAMDYRRNRVGGCSFVFPLSSTRDCSGVYAAGRVTGAKGFWELVIKVVSNIVW